MSRMSRIPPAATASRAVPPARVGSRLGRSGHATAPASSPPTPTGSPDPATPHHPATLSARRQEGLMDKLLTVEEVAERLGTSVRFVRRLVFERRIAYHKVGRHVRIAARDLDAFIRAGRVDVGESPTMRQGA